MKNSRGCEKNIWKGRQSCVQKNMRAGEKGILIFIAVLVVGTMVYKGFRNAVDEKDPGVPFYTTASPELKHGAEVLYKRLECSNCHTMDGAQYDGKRTRARVGRYRVAA